MLLATVWRHAAICELYRDETSQRLSLAAQSKSGVPEPAPRRFRTSLKQPRGGIVEFLAL
jgi:hypothetical protein